MFHAIAANRAQTVRAQPLAEPVRARKAFRDPNAMNAPKAMPVTNARNARAMHEARCPAVHVKHIVNAK